MSGFTAIESALASRLNTMTGGWPIAWPNREYRPANGTSYLRPHNLPGSTRQAALGVSGRNRCFGVYQIDVMYAGGADGWGVTGNKVDQIAEHFKRGTAMTSGAVTVVVERVEPGPGMNERGWWRVPVSIYYRADTAN